MLSKRKIIEKAFELDDEDFSKIDYENVLNYFYEKDSTLSDLIIDKNLRLNNFAMIPPAIEKRILKLKKNSNLPNKLKLVDYRVTRILRILIQAVYEINSEHFYENISDDEFYSKFYNEENSEEILKIIDKIKISKIKRFYDSNKFNTELKLKLFAKDLSIDLKLAKSWDKEKIEYYSNLISKILTIYSDLHKNSGRQEFKITESKLTQNKILKFNQFLNSTKSKLKI